MTVVDGDVFLIESRRSLRKRERMAEKLTTDIERTKEVYGHLPWSVNVENIIEIARKATESYLLWGLRRMFTL